MPQGGNRGGGKAYKNDLVLLSAEEEATAALTSLLPSPCLCCVVMAGHTHYTQHRERERECHGHQGKGNARGGKN